MKRQALGIRQWILVVGIAPLALACGSDEVVKDDGNGSDDTPAADDASVADDTKDDSTPPLDDTPAAGGRPSGGAGGAVNVPNQDDALVGMFCEQDADCADGLTCLLESAFFIAEGTIPSGICTARCEDDAELCGALDVESVCLGGPTDPNDPNSVVGYCVDGCEPGQGSGCNGVIDRYCRPIGMDGAGACWPRCFDDVSCGPDKVCDGATGACLDAERAGKGLGEACSAAEDCNGGVCYLADQGADGVCSEQCIFTPFRGACGDSRDANTPPAFMCWPPVGVLLDETVPFRFGDLGLCTQTCDVDGDCASGFVCVEVTDALAAEIGKAGFCLQEVFFGEQPPMGGAGGMGNGGAPSGGNGNLGGAGGQQ